jgi:hypothetical protein
MGFQGIAVIPAYVTWDLNIIRVVLLVYVVFSCKMKKINLVWMLVLSPGCFAIKIRN